MTKRSTNAILAWTLLSLLRNTYGFIPASRPLNYNNHRSLHLHSHDSSKSPATSRSNFLHTTLPSFFIATSALVNSEPAAALVKGNAPPPKKKVSDKAKIQCTSIDECQEKEDKLIAEEKLAQEKAEADAANDERILKGPKGSRYRDLKVGDASSTAVELGDTVEIYYKVLKLGKRSYDGLSGEGTVVFSRGYGLEDDEGTDPNKRESFQCTVGSPYLIAALSDALPGMLVGSIRRISVSPQMGWEIPTKECDGGPGGKGAGGELKTDYVVVPTATMVSTESCFAKDKSPFPQSYAQQRRMAQRFDQSLIIEVELAKNLGKL